MPETRTYSEEHVHVPAAAQAGKVKWIKIIDETQMQQTKGAAAAAASAAAAAAAAATTEAAVMSPGAAAAGSTQLDTR